MRKIEKEKLREKLAKWQFSKISIRTKSENSRFVKINPCEKKTRLTVFLDILIIITLRIFFKC